MNRKEKNALSRQRILEAALEEFSRRGYEAASLSNVCAEKGISKGIIYHHFKDKDELFLLCVEDCFTQVSAYLQEAAGRLSGTAEAVLPQAKDYAFWMFIAALFNLPAQSLNCAARAEAIGQLCPALLAEISGDWLEQPGMDVRNLYYEITAAWPELKYVYELEIDSQAESLVCTFHYMPYKTEDFPEGFAGQDVSSLPELIAVSEENMGQELIPIRITNRALQQAGGACILCMLNRDATAIQYTTPFGWSMEDCLSSLAETEQLANQVIAQVIDMRA